MATNVRIIHAWDFIRAIPEGTLDAPSSKRVLADIAAASAGLTDFQILIDTRKTNTVLTATDLFYLVEELSERRSLFARRTAVLCPTSRFDHAEFFALCAQNRGLLVSAFTSFEDAIDWLIAEWSDA